MAYLDYPGLAYFKSLLDENYLRTNYEGDTVINGNVTFTKPVDASVKNDWLGQQIDKTYLKDVVPDPEGSGALALILGDGTVSHLVTDTTVTQVRSNANELYPILLCYDASAEEDQIAKKVWYGNGVRINPRYGYLYSQKMLTLHSTYNRAAAPTSRVEWTSDFRDSVLNPVGQIFEYIDPVSQGGEHRMELRLYGNPNVAGINTPNVNYETNTVSLGVSATRGDALTFFGYAPSTPIYLEDGSTMRKSLVRGDQYGKDIITRDWLNLNGSITGLVHTYMDETIDGYKTFLKTVTIDSGDDNNKAGLNVQGDVNIDSGDANKPSSLYVQGNSHVHGNEDIDGNLNVDGTSDQHGNVHMYNNLAVDGTTTTRILHVTDDATVDDDLNVGGDANVAGTINKVSGNTTQEYVTYVTNQADTRKDIAAGLVDTSKGLGYDPSTGKIYIKAATTDGLKFLSNGNLAVDFSQMPTDKFEALLKGLKMQIPLSTNIELYVDQNNANAANTLIDGRGTEAKPFKTIQACINYVTQNYAFGVYHCTIYVKAGTYEESLNLPEFTRSSGYIHLRGYAKSKNAVVFSRNGAGTLGCNGGNWIVEYLHLKHECHETITDYNGVEVAIGCNNGSTLYLKGNKYEIVYPSNFNNNSDKYHDVRLICADTGGHIHMEITDVASEFIPRKQGVTRTSVFSILRASTLYLYSYSGNDSSKITNYPCSGDATVFAEASGNSTISTVSSGRHPSFNASPNYTGFRYRCVAGGNMSVHGSGDGTYFPGVDTYVESSTYSWYTD